MTTVVIKIGIDLQKEAEEIKNAIRRHEDGEDVREAVITFETWDLFTRLFTRRRLELLRHLHRRPEESIRSLSKALGRDYANVHADVKALVEAGLIDDDEGLRFEYESIQLPEIPVQASSEEIGLMKEEDVIKVIIECASTHDFGELIGRAGSHGAGTGIDVAFRNADGLMYVFEAKGAHSDYGRCQHYFDSGFARLPQMAYGRKSLRLLDGTVERGIVPDFISLAVPDTVHYRRHAEAFISAFRTLGYGLYFARKGELDPVVKPRMIERKLTSGKNGLGST